MYSEQRSHLSLLISRLYATLGYNPPRSAVVKEPEFSPFLPLGEKAVQSDVQATGTTRVAALTPQRLPLLLGNQAVCIPFR